MSTAVRSAYETLKAQEGLQRSVPVGPIEARDYQRFAYAVGHTDPRYLIPPGSHTASGEPAQAPPIYLSAVMEWSPGPEESSLRPDGSQPDSTAGLPLEGLRLMGAGQELEFHSPVTDGARLTQQLSVESVDLKEGRSGALIVLRLRREYRREDGAPILTCIETVIAR